MEFPPIWLGVEGVVAINPFGHFRSKVCQLIDQAHVRPNPLTSFFHGHIHRMEIRLVSFVETISNHQRSRPRYTQLTMNQDLFASLHTLVDDSAQSVQVLQYLRIMIPGHMQIFRLLLLQE